MASRKPYIEVVSIKDRKDGDCDITLDVNQAGKQLLMEAGVQKILRDSIESHSEKLSLWNKLQICWSILR